MGIIMMKLLETIYAGQAINILMVGLFAAGKTTILNRLTMGAVVTSTPVLGFNVETANYQNLGFTVFDVGGKKEFRSQWRNYFSNKQGIIFVVDSTDRARIQDAREELDRVLRDDDLRDAVLLVFANKQDLPNRMSVAEIIVKLGLNNLRTRAWNIHGSCATCGEGLYEGLDWLSNQLKNTA